MSLSHPIVLASFSDRVTCVRVKSSTDQNIPFIVDRRFDNQSVDNSTTNRSSNNRIILKDGG